MHNPLTFALAKQKRSLAHEVFFKAYNEEVSDSSRIASPEELDALLLKLDAMKNVRGIVVGVVTDKICEHGNVIGPHVEVLGIGTGALMSAVAGVLASELDYALEEAAAKGSSPSLFEADSYNFEGDGRRSPFAHEPYDPLVAQLAAVLFGARRPRGG